MLASRSKSVGALLFNVRAFAAHNGVEQELLSEWAISLPQLAAKCERDAAVMAPKAGHIINDMIAQSPLCRRGGLCLRWLSSHNRSAVPACPTASTPQRPMFCTSCSVILASYNCCQVFSRLSSFRGAADTTSVGDVVTALHHHSQPVQAQEAETKTTASETQPLAKKLRVMCLHGWRTSAEIMRIQLRHFPKDMLDMHFINGPHDANGYVKYMYHPIYSVITLGSPPPPPVDKFFSGPYYEWWDRQGEVYVGADASVKAIAQYETDHGPFDGIIGFSQVIQSRQICSEVLSFSCRAVPSPQCWPRSTNTSPTTPCSRT